MAGTTTSEKVKALIAACEDGYADACRKGYAEIPAVIAAVAAVKSAHTAWTRANRQRRAAKGLFRVMLASLRARRACRLTQRACVALQSALEEAAAENHLHNRCLLLFGSESKQAKAFTVAA
jgi:hypothetical protein